MQNYTQKSYVRKYGNRDNFMEVNIIDDIRYLVDFINDHLISQFCFVCIFHATSMARQFCLTLIPL